jgi:hypothetical protein
LWFENSKETLVRREVSSEVASVDRRRSRREQRAQEVQVRGFDATGRYFSERTTTKDISEGGCRVTLRTAVTIGTILRVTILASAAGGNGNGAAAQFEVVWTRQQGDSCEVGTRLVKGSSPWGPTTERMLTALSGF